MISPREAIKLMQYLEPLPENNGLFFLSAAAIRTALRKDPHCLIDCSFYRGTTHIQENGWAKLVHGIDREKLKEFSCAKISEGYGR